MSKAEEGGFGVNGFEVDGGRVRAGPSKIGLFGSSEDDNLGLETVLGPDMAGLDGVVILGA